MRDIDLRRRDQDPSRDRRNEIQAVSGSKRYFPGEGGFFPPCRFNPTDKRTEITYKQIDAGSVHRISKGMSHVILDLCTREKTNELIQQLNKDVDEFAERGLRALAVAIEDVPGGTVDAQGNGFKLIGLIPIYDPPREDTKETIERALQIGRIRIVQSFRRRIAPRSRRCEGENDHWRSTGDSEGNWPTPRHGRQDVLVQHIEGRTTGWIRLPRY